MPKLTEKPKKAKAVGEKKAKAAGEKKYKTPNVDDSVYSFVEDIRTIAGRMDSLSLAELTNLRPVKELSDQLKTLANNLENTDQALYADSYGYCCELISPHVKTRAGGFSEISEDSLIHSVGETLEYLLRFWEANRGKPGVDHLLDPAL